MTRAEKEAKARELRSKGLLPREIAEEMGVARTTVAAWLSDPGGLKLAARKRSYAGTWENVVRYHWSTWNAFIREGGYEPTPVGGYDRETAKALRAERVGAKAA